jgi:BirA family biotin operon repressor/biotin-[acetyl-CoA-carboxylase] ligase
MRFAEPHSILQESMIATAKRITKANVNPKLITYQKVTSTQDVARELALNGESEGTAILAMEQENGRGRLGRAWNSPTGKNIALSLILRPKLAPPQAALLSLLTSIAVAETLESAGVPSVRLKWPNDVLVNGKKIAGILLEANLSNKGVDYVIIGIGLNLNSELKDFPPELRDIVTSFLIETGREANLVETAYRLLADISSLCRQVDLEGPGFIPRLWETRWAHKGLTVVVQDMEGIAESLDSDGALMVRKAGQLIRVNSGEVFPKTD